MIHMWHLSEKISFIISQHIPSGSCLGWDSFIDSKPGKSHVPSGRIDRRPVELTEPWEMWQQIHMFIYKYTSLINAMLYNLGFCFLLEIQEGYYKYVSLQTHSCD